MKFLALVFIALIALLQYPLWYGKGSWLRVWELDKEVKAARQTNHELQNRNTILEAEVNDLKQGLDAIEERARSELGMVKQDEMFFQISKSNRHNKPRVDTDNNIEHIEAPPDWSTEVLGFIQRRVDK